MFGTAGERNETHHDALAKLGSLALGATVLRRRMRQRDVGYQRGSVRGSDSIVGVGSNPVGNFLALRDVPVTSLSLGWCPACKLP